MRIRERSISPLTGVVGAKQVEKENVTVTVNVIPGGIPMVVFLIFLVLKLTGQVAWSWVWITSPLWLGAAFVVLLAVIATAVVAFKK